MTAEDLRAHFVGLEHSQRVMLASYKRMEEETAASRRSVLVYADQVCDLRAIAPPFRYFLR